MKRNICHFKRKSHACSRLVCCAIAVYLDAEKLFQNISTWKKEYPPSFVIFFFLVQAIAVNKIQVKTEFLCQERLYSSLRHHHFLNTNIFPHFRPFSEHCSGVTSYQMCVYVVQTLLNISSSTILLLPPPQEGRWTAACARPRPLRSPWPARCPARGTACSATGRRGPPAPRPAPARTSRESRWGRAPSWPTTPAKVSRPASAAFPHGAGSAVAFSKSSSAVTRPNVWISHLSALCVFVLISNSLLICAGDYFCWSVSSPDTHFLSPPMITSRGLNAPCFFLFLVCLSARLYFCRVSKRLPRVLSGCVFSPHSHCDGCGLDHSDGG